MAIQLFTLGIPCIYYGTEQAFAGPERSERDQHLHDYGGTDRYLREAMFGPEHPRLNGRAALGGATAFDAQLPGVRAVRNGGRPLLPPEGAGVCSYSPR